MQMQEPERRQQSRQRQEGSNDYAQGYPSVPQEQSGQPDYVEVVVGEEPYQEQKIHPQNDMRARIGVMPVAGMVLSAIAFCASIAGIVLSAIVLKYGPVGSDSKLAGGVGLAAAIFVLLLSIAIFVISVIVLAVRYSRARGRSWRAAGRYVGSRYR